MDVFVIGQAVHEPAARIGGKRLEEIVFDTAHAALTDAAGATNDPQGESATRLTVEAVLAGMPPRRRFCATLSFIEGLSANETATALGIAPATVRKQLDLARRNE